MLLLTKVEPSLMTLPKFYKLSWGEYSMGLNLGWGGFLRVQPP